MAGSSAVGSRLSRFAVGMGKVEAAKVIGSFSLGTSCPAHRHDCSSGLKGNFTQSADSREFAFEMISSTLRFGSGVTAEVGMDLSNMGARRSVVLLDPNVSKLPMAKTLLDSLVRSGVDFKVFTDIRVEPTDKSVMEAIKFCRSLNVDSYVAMGGGSTIDTAKIANLYASNPQADFFDFVEKPFGLKLQPQHKLKPLIAIPTTAGTGSETTAAAIFDLEDLRVKTGIRSKAIKPHLAIIDPLNIATMPRHVAIYSGFDVLCHSLESFTCRPYNTRTPRPSNPAERPVYQGSNPISDIWAREAMRTICKFFRRSVDDPTDMEAKSAMLMAASFAGMGFGNAGVHLCHGLSYPISGAVRDYHSPDYSADVPLIPHGLSVIMTAAADFQFTAEANLDRHLEAAKLLGAQLDGVKKPDAGQILGDIIRGFVRDFGVPNGLKAVGFDRGDTAQLAQTALKSLTSLQLCPREQTLAVLEQIYEDSLTVY